MTRQIYTCLWFDGNAKEGADFYCSVFKNSKINSENPFVVKFEINGTEFMALNGGPQYKFSLLLHTLLSVKLKKKLTIIGKV